MSLNSITGMSHISEVVEETNQRLYRFKTGQLKPLKTFSKKLDSAIGGFYPGDQITIAARPGVGKSAFVNVLVDAIENNNKDTKTVILYFSLEMANYSQVIRLYSKETGITSKALQSAWEPLPEDSWNNVLKMSDRLKNRNIFFRDHKVTRYSWRKTMEEAFEKFRGHQLVSIVDHTRLITKMGGEKSEEEKITEFMADAVEFKNQTDSINIFLSQLNRNIESASGADREAVGKSAPRLTDKHKKVRLKSLELLETPEAGNQQPNLMNDIEVVREVQRLMREESTNKRNTSEGQLVIIDDIV